MVWIQKPLAKPQIQTFLITFLADQSVGALLRPLLIVVNHWQVYRSLVPDLISQLNSVVRKIKISSLEPPLTTVIGMPLQARSDAARKKALNYLSQTAQTWKTLKPCGLRANLLKTLIRHYPCTRPRSSTVSSHKRDSSIYWPSITRRNLLRL